MSQKQPNPLPAGARRDSPANAYLAPPIEGDRRLLLAHDLQTLRENFVEYTSGRLSEKDFKAAVSEYAAALRRLRDSVPDSQTARPAQ